MVDETTSPNHANVPADMAKVLADQKAQAAAAGQLAGDLGTLENDLTPAPVSGSLVGGVSPGQYLATMNSMSATALAATIAAMKANAMTYLRIDASNYNGNGAISAQYDNVVAAAFAGGLTPHLIFEDNSGNWDASFGAWCKIEAAHYSQMAGGKPFVIEIGNEINEAFHWSSNTPNPAQYAACLKSAYPLIKSVGAIPVIFSGLAPWGGPTGNTNGTNGSGMNMVDFFKGAYAAGSGPFCDALNVHPYVWNDLPGLPADTDPGNPWMQLAAIRALMLANGDSAKVIWCTEFGTPTGTDAGQTNPQSQTGQANVLAQALSMWKALSYTGPFIGFSWFDTTSDGDFGLFTAAGVAKSALAAWKAGLA